jgi:hypothetical protein
MKVKMEKDRWIWLYMNTKEDDNHKSNKVYKTTAKVGFHIPNND